MNARQVRMDNYLYKSLIVILVLISALSFMMVKDFTGYASHTAGAGWITFLNVEHVTPALNWNGFYGLMLMAQVNNTQTADATNAGMSEETFVFPCLEPNRVHELYASWAPPWQIEWNNLTAGNTTLLDEMLGINPEESYSVTRTFSRNIYVEVGGQRINNAPGTYTYQIGDRNSTEFESALLQDINGTFIFFTHETNGYIQGFNGDMYNFQMMVTVPLNTTLTYYFTADPFDECPEGYGETAGIGWVYGWVFEEGSGVLLGDVHVSLAGVSYVTNASGYYNLTVPQGTHHIVAYKAGYEVHIGNVTIPLNNGTEYNITLEPEQPPQPGQGPGTGTGPGEGPGVGPGVGPGIGPGIGPYTEEPKEIEGIDYWISIDEIYRNIRIGNFLIERLILFSYKESTARITFQLTGNATEVMELDKNDIAIQPRQRSNLTLTILGHKLGVFNGSLIVGGDINHTIPVRIVVSEKDKLPIEALLVQLETLTRRPYLGDLFKFRVNLHNFLIEQSYNVTLYYQIIGEDNNRTASLPSDTVEILTSTSLIRSFQIPRDWQLGDYRLNVEAHYLGLTSTASNIFTVTEPFYLYELFGVVPLWQLFLMLLGLALLILLVLLIRRRIEAKKRFHVKVDYSQLPKPGPRSIFVGKIAETENKAYFDMDNLTVHTIVAGSTGGGKTISAQVIIEECLLKNIAVVVFDPTAQWSGMLRKCEDQKMFLHYPEFGMKQKDSRTFNGNVRSIEDPRELIDLNKHLKPGEIQIFTVNKLDPKDIDIFVANTVRQVFRSNLQEFRGLKAMIVYDEVHRLLPKFGGSGQGFIQIERACREFRKWGIGVMLVSQVLADFVGQIKANINTEVQMKTRDEGDLERIKTKFGGDFIQSLVKSPVGTGMVQNSAYNRGNPYFVTFRPILHSVKRLTDEELSEYNKYNAIADDYEFQLEQLEKEGVDVFDLKLELKLATDKIKQGGFNMVEIYLEGLKPRLEKQWEKLGKKPKKLEKKLVSQEDLEKDLQAAKKSRKEYEKKQEAEQKKEAKEEGPKALGFSDDVPPDKMLKLKNDMLVLNLSSLLDEVKAMKDEDFKFHVNDEKNDLANWIRDVVMDKVLADKAAQVITKDDMVGLLEAKEQGKEKDYVVKNPKPEQSKEGGEQKEGEQKEGEQKEGEQKEGEQKEGEQKKESDEKKEGEKEGKGEDKPQEKEDAAQKQ